MAVRMSKTLSGFDGAPGLDEFVHDGDGRGRALLKHQGGVREGLLAVLAQFVLEVVVLADPAAQGALTDVGLAGGGGDGARGEHGSDGAFLAGSEPVEEDIGVASTHISTLAGDWGKARGGFVKWMVLKGIKVSNNVTGSWGLAARGASPRTRKKGTASRFPQPTGIGNKQVPRAEIGGSPHFSPGRGDRWTQGDMPPGICGQALCSSFSGA